MVQRLLTLNVFHGAKVGAGMERVWSTIEMPGQGRGQIRVEARIESALLELLVFRPRWSTRLISGLGEGIAAQAARRDGPKLWITRGRGAFGAVAPSWCCETSFANVSAPLSFIYRDSDYVGVYSQKYG